MPEFSEKVRDNEKFVELIVNNKEEKVKDSMGADLTKEDLAPINSLAKQINSLFAFKNEQTTYFEKTMKGVSIMEADTEEQLLNYVAELWPPIKIKFVPLLPSSEFIPKYLKAKE